MDDPNNANSSGSPEQELADRLKSANNILVTVSRNPSVDQLAACLGLTILLNKMNKHSVAVFSGQVPSTIEFLKPAETIEKTTDSLRDFIIALDKDKADKLRYKVEDNVVRIFITPYKTSISEKDLEFSQGDFNVDVVVGLGVKQQEDLDQAITAHGRILHDATVASINLSQDASGLGTINWQDPKASSLSELVTDLAQLLGDKLLDNQIATALLTGIVAETNRFSNDKTSSQTMEASSVLMAAGANQQLVANKLEQSAKPKQSASDEEDSDQPEDEEESSESPDGTLTISHAKEKDPGGKKAAKKGTPRKDEDNKQPPTELPTPMAPQAQPLSPQPLSPPPKPSFGSQLKPGAKYLGEPSTLDGSLTANTKPEGLDPVTDPLSMPKAEPDQLLERPKKQSASKPTGPPLTPLQISPQPAPAPAPIQAPPPTPAPSPVSTPLSPPPLSPAPLTPPTSPFTPPAATGVPGGAPQTLTEIERSVDSPHVDESKLNTARDEVEAALKDSVEEMPTPISALNAQPLGGSLHSDSAPPPEIKPKDSPPLPLGPPAPESSDTNPNQPLAPDLLSPTPQVTDSTAPPPVAPPLPQEAIDNASKTPGQQPPAPL